MELARTQAHLDCAGARGVAGRGLRQLRSGHRDPGRAGRAGARRGRAGVRGLPDRLTADAARPRAPRGDRGGAGAASARDDDLRRGRGRDRACRGDRPHRALRGDRAPHRAGRRGGHVRDPAGARLRRAVQGPEVRGQLSRHEHRGANVPHPDAAGERPARHPRRRRHSVQRRRRRSGRAGQRDRHPALAPAIASALASGRALPGRGERHRGAVAEDRAARGGLPRCEARGGAPAL